MITENHLKELQQHSDTMSNISYKGIKLNTVFSKDIRYIVQDKTNLRSWLIVFALIPLKIEGNLKNAKVLYSVFDQNPSMSNLMELSLKNISKKAEIKFLYNKLQPNLPSLKHFIFSFRNIFLNKNIKIKLKYRIYFTIRGVFYAKYIDYCLRLLGNKKADAYISLYGGGGFIEDIINQIFKLNNRNVALISLEHGLRPPNITSKRFINFEITSEYMLNWGKYNLDNINHIGVNKKIIICGNPKYSYQKKLKTTKNKNMVTVFLDPGIKPYLTSNINMLKLIIPVLESKGLKFQLKMHPGRHGTQKSFQNHFKDKLNFIDESAEQLIVESLFCICTSSTVFVEGTYYGVPFLRFKDINLPFLKMKPENIIFYDEKSFVDLVERLLNKKQYDKFSKNMWSKCNYYFAFCDKDVPKIYAGTIKKIISDKSKS